MIARSYPLDWPPSRTRTTPERRQYARFFKLAQQVSAVTGSSYTEKRDKTIRESEIDLIEELDRLGAGNAVISSNLRLNRDGTFSSAQAEPEDPGVAVFFSYKGQKMAFACDRWKRTADNLYAIAKTIEALRGIERWGSGEMVRAAFTGFRALPLPQRPWRMVFGFSENENPTVEEVDRRHKEAARRFHPDVGDQIVGSGILMAEINAARDEARRELAG